MQKYFWEVFAVLFLVGAALNIAWDKETAKAFITGGIFVWMGTKLFKA